MILVIRAGGLERTCTLQSSNGTKIEWREVPVLRLVPRRVARRDLLGALEPAGRGGWVLFSSPHTIEILAGGEQEGPSWEAIDRALREHPLATVGPISARTLEARGFRVDLVSPVQTVRGTISALVEKGAQGIVWAGNASGDRTALDLARAAKIPVSFVEVYAEEVDEERLQKVRTMLREGSEGRGEKIGAVGITSPEVARLVGRALGGGRFSSELPVGALGSVTAAALASEGVEDVRTSPEASIPGLVRFLARGIT